jgi:hypothetical protein
MAECTQAAASEDAPTLSSDGSTLPRVYLRVAGKQMWSPSQLHLLLRIAAARRLWMNWESWHAAT